MIPPNMSNSGADSGGWLDFSRVYTVYLGNSEAATNLTAVRTITGSE